MFATFSEMYRFQDYVWKKHPLLAIFDRIPYPNRVTRVTRSLFKNRPLYSIVFTHMHPICFLVCRCVTCFPFFVPAQLCSGARSRAAFWIQAADHGSLRLWLFRNILHLSEHFRFLKSFVWMRIFLGRFVLSLQIFVRYCPATIPKLVRQTYMSWSSHILLCHTSCYSTFMAESAWVKSSFWALWPDDHVCFRCLVDASGASFARFSSVEYTCSTEFSSWRKVSSDMSAFRVQCL
jgi:hypothetical protein